MTGRYGSILRAAAAGVLVLIGGTARAEPQFDKAAIYLERNADDDDIEVRIVAKADDTGFATLRVIAPDGRTVIDFKAPQSRLGIRQLDLESPEPRDKDSVLADFPEGTYRFEGTLVGGATLRADATLRHDLPAAPILSVPREGQTELSANGAKVRWEPVADAAAIQVVLKESKGLRELRATLPGNSTAFAIPDGFLVPGSKYEVAVGAVRQSGNRSYQEIDFTATAEAAQTTTDGRRSAKSSDYSSAKDWFLKADTIVPHGHSPFFFPLVPGHKHILEWPDHPEGHFRKETAVLDRTEPFDLPTIGKFETAVVQEEEYVDEELVQRAHLWLAIDRTTNSVHVFGQVTWEVEDGKPIITGSWRAGDPPGNSAAEPGLAMPGILAVGARHVVNGGEDGPASGAETLETGVEKTVPAGTFKNCVRIREQGLVGEMEAVERVWCPRVGLVADSASGQLIASNALPPAHPGADVSSFGKYLANVPPPPEPKLTAEQATEAALKRMPGRMTSVVIERKRGRYVYVVEIMTSDTGERDVLVDIQSGEIVGIE